MRLRLTLTLICIPRWRPGRKLHALRKTTHAATRNELLGAAHEVPRQERSGVRVLVE
jgi:hypothetical protein